MKKLLSLALALALCLGLVILIHAAAPGTTKVTAAPSSCGVLVNGKEVIFDAYGINGSNYFKLRDLAFILSGSDVQFDVAWDKALGGIFMTSGDPYTPVGGEMDSKGGAGRTGTLYASKIYLDGQPVDLTAYTISRNNYFKLRDIGALFDFDVYYDSQLNKTAVDTTKPYEKVMPLITAHSGADGTPDNSLDYVRYALQSAADTLEVDVRRGPEDVLAIGHNEVDETSPTLREVFTLVSEHPSMRVNCDLKEEGLEPEVCRLARECGMAGRIIFTGIAEAAWFARDPAEGCEVWLNLEIYVPDVYQNYKDIPDFDLEAAEKIVEVCTGAGIRVVNMDHGLATERFIEALAEKGIGVSAWTVDDPEMLEWCLSHGVRNITTRNLKTALDMRASLDRYGE